MIEGFANVMGMAATQVILEFQVPRPLSPTGRLRVQLLAIFFVEVPSVDIAILHLIESPLRILGGLAAK